MLDKDLVFHVNANELHKGLQALRKLYAPRGRVKRGRILDRVLGVGVKCTIEVRDVDLHLTIDRLQEFVLVPRQDPTSLLPNWKQAFRQTYQGEPCVPHSVLMPFDDIFNISQYVHSPVLRFSSSVDRLVVTNEPSTTVWSWAAWAFGSAEGYNVCV